jgi:hypothetical protein
MKERRTERTLDRDGGSSACMVADMGAERQERGLLRTFFHVMPARLGDGLPERDGDPKGVGASTTRARYSRKRHRHTSSFLCCAHSASSYVPVGIADFSSLPILANSCQTSKFYQTPGAIGTLFSNMS